jgi:hypothetical protein
MSNRTSVTTANSELLADNSLVSGMFNASPQQVVGMLKRISDAVDLRASSDPVAFASADFRHLAAWKDNNALARFFVAAKVDPKHYLMQYDYDAVKLAKLGIDKDAVTKNLKAYEKVRQIAEYIASGSSKLQPVVKTFVACCIQASQHVDVIQSDTFQRFLSGIKLDYVSSDLADAVEAFQAKHMTDGAKTQASQCILTLANLGCGTVLVDGLRKHFVLDASSPVTQAFAERFGMQATLAKVAQRQAA